MYEASLLLWMKRLISILERERERKRESKWERDFRLSKAFQTTVFFQGKKSKKKGEHRLKQSIAGEDTDKGPGTKKNPLKKSFAFLLDFPLRQKVGCILLKGIFRFG